MQRLHSCNDRSERRILVVGTNITMVQRVSSYCLEWGAVVLPYYGTPSDEEIQLFDPQLWVLCLPIPQNLQLPTTTSLLIWEEPPVVLQAINTRADLHMYLEQCFVY